MKRLLSLGFLVVVIFALLGCQSQGSAEGQVKMLEERSMLGQVIEQTPLQQQGVGCEISVVFSYPPSAERAEWPSYKVLTPEEKCETIELGKLYEFQALFPLEASTWTPPEEVRW